MALALGVIVEFDRRRIGFKSSTSAQQAGHSDGPSKTKPDPAESRTNWRVCSRKPVEAQST